jgi:hypothetical protein
MGKKTLFDSKAKPNVYFIRDDNEDGKLYDLCHDYLGQGRLPRKEINATWTALAWKQCGLVTISSLCKVIHDCQNLKELTLSSDSRFDGVQWINAVLNYIVMSSKTELLNQFNVIPNQELVFIRFSVSGIAIGESLTPLMLDVLKSLGQNLRPILVHNSITSLDSLLQVKLTPRDVSLRIDSCVDKLITAKKRSRCRSAEIIDAIWPILGVVPTGDNCPDAFCVAQKQFFFFVSRLAGRPTTPIKDNDIERIAWAHANEWCRDWLLKGLQRCGTVIAFGQKCPSDDPVSLLNSFYEFMRKQVNEDKFHAACIFPDQKGTFKEKRLLFHNDIPPVFLTPAFEKHGLLLCEQLLHSGITTIQLGQTKTIRDVGEFVANYFIRHPITSKHTRSSGRAQVSSTSTYDPALWDLVLRLIHILPFEDSDDYDRNKILLKLTRKLFPSEVRAMTKTVLPTDLPGAWERPLVLCLNKVIAAVEELQNMKALTLKVRKSGEFLDNLFELVETFHIGDKAKIYPDQHGSFHVFTELFDGSELPKPLKDALWELSEHREDVRPKLMDPRCQKAFADRVFPKFPLNNVCIKIDNCVKAIHEDLSQHGNRIFQKHITYLHAEWIEKRDDAATLFPYFTEHKQAILCAIILDKRRLGLLTHFADWEAEDIEAIIAQPDTVTTLRERCQSMEVQLLEFQQGQERLMEEQKFLRQLNQMDANKISALLTAADPVETLLNERELLKDELKKLREERAALQQSGSESKTDDQWSRTAIETRIARHAPIHEEVVKNVSHVFSSFLPPSFDFHRLSRYLEDECDLPAMQEVGYLGEAAVFRDLRDSNKFSKVIWPNQTNQSGRPRITSGGETFFVNEVGHSYDIEAITFHEKRVLVEVKSTVRDLGDRSVGHHFGRLQLELFGRSPTQHQSVLALVFNARNAHPLICYFSIGEFAEMPIHL